MSTIDYKKAGVDPEKAAGIITEFAGYLKSRPKDPLLLAGIGPFAACYQLKPLLQQFEDPILVTTCDGVGTKLKLGLEWGKIDGLGQDLVAMNVNDLLCAGARPFLFMDYYACGKLDETQLLTLLKSIQVGCEQAGSSLAGGETAEMPGLYENGDFDLAGFAVGVVDKKDVLGPSRVKPGDTLLAVASSGPHSNGFSLIRKIVEKEGLKPDDKNPFDGRLWKDILLKPTTIYVYGLREVLKNCHAAAHITGGGLFENLPRVLPDDVTAKIFAASWKIPPLFEWLQEKAGLSTRDLLSTFNCGVGMILACEESYVPTAITKLESKGLKSWEIGRVEKAQPGEARVTWS